MGKLFWGQDHKDVKDWVKQLTMAVKVKDINANKLFKTIKLNLRCRAKECFKKLNVALVD
jgi:hypothetical protein